MAVKDWSTTPSSNVTIDGIDIAEDCDRANMNDMGRSIMASVKRESQNVASILSSGAVGNGSTDDTTNANSAYGAMITAGGGVCFIPPQFTIKAAMTLNSRTGDLRGGGFSSKITPATATGVAVRGTYNSGTWDSVVLSDFWVAGIGTLEGVGVKLGPDTYSINSEYVGRTIFDRLKFSNLDKGIERPFGNIGFWLNDCTFGAANYHLFVKDNGSGSGDLMHGGNTVVSRGHFEGAEKASVYVASDTIGTGQVSFENVIFENNPGYVFYVDAFNCSDGFPCGVVANCWNENNYTAGSITVEGDTASAIYGYFNDTPVWMFQNTPLGPLRLTNSGILTENCDLSKLTAVTKDSDSTITHYRARLFSGVAKGFVDSIGTVENADALNSPWYPMARPVGFRFYNAPTTVHDFQAVTSFTGTASVSTTNVTNDPAMPNLPNVQELSIGAGQTLYRAADFTVPANKYIVARLLVRAVSGTSVSASITGSAGVGGAFTIDETDWRSLTAIIKTGGSPAANDSIRYVNSSGGASVIRIAYECVVPFDTAQEALNFANSGCVMAMAPVDYTVTNGATLRTFDANTVTTADLADVVATLIADLQGAKALI